jgi:tRNA(Ile)-lysidine synthase
VTPRGDRPDPPPAPLTGSERDALFAGWPSHPRVALAVSGGADSMALMLLAREWAEGRKDAPALFILTVDHGLRAEAADEAAWVRGQAAGLGLSHETLRWTGAKPCSGIQAAARAARYDLMLGFCREAGIDALATAHTADDQTETLLMRLARGSGLDGLAGIPAVSVAGGVTLLRPLLAVPRIRLEAALRECGQSWLEDPSNRDSRYERARLRQTLRGGSAPPLTAEKLALSARRMQRARLALEGVTEGFLAEALRIHPAGFGEIGLAALLGELEEIGLRALARMMALFGGGARPVRLARIEALHAALAEAQDRTRAATLGGCVFELRRGAMLRVVREFGRIAPARVMLAPGKPMLWDGRFTISVPEAATGEGLAAGPLGPRGLAELAALGGRIALPARIAHALPGIWRGERLVFAPFAAFEAGPPLDWLAGPCAEFRHEWGAEMLP